MLTFHRGFWYRCLDFTDFDRGWLFRLTCHGFRYVRMYWGHLASQWWTQISVALFLSRRRSVVQGLIEWQVIWGFWIHHPNLIPIGRLGFCCLGLLLFLNLGWVLGLRSEADHLVLFGTLTLILLHRFRPLYTHIDWRHIILLFIGKNYFLIPEV